MNNQTQLFNDLVDLNDYLKQLVRDFNAVRSMTLDNKTSDYYDGRLRQLNDCIALIEDILDKNAYDVEKVADEKLVKEVITRFYK